MIGAIIGDIAGSRFEWHNHKSKDFELLHPACHFTDDTAMTLAVAQALLRAGKTGSLAEETIRALKEQGRAYPDCGYGRRFRAWVLGDSQEPYGSYANGSAMRASACAWAAESLENAAELARITASVTHDHPEAVAGAQAAACAGYLARTGSTREEIRAYIEAHFYRLDFTLDAIRPDYAFDVSCRGSVPQAIEAFLESADFEDAIRCAISIGGDSDTIAAITGGIAEAFYGVPAALRAQAEGYLTAPQLEILRAAEAAWGRK